MAKNKNKILKNAEKYIEKGQFLKAINEYRKLTQEEYGEHSLDNIIGDILYRMGRVSEAIEEYEKAGRYYEKKGFSHKALAIYKKIARLDRNKPSIYEKVAQISSDMGLIQDAISQYEHLAQYYEQNGNMEAALDSYRQIADLDPSNLTIRERLAVLYAKQGFHEKACEEFVKIGERYIRRNDMMAALKRFESALKENPDSEAALRGIVSVHLAEKRVDEAGNILNKILEKQPDNISALITLGRMFMDTGELDKAIEIFKKVSRLDPAQEGVTEMLGRIYILKGDYEQAFLQLKEIINTAIENEDFEKALNILEQLQKVESKNIHIYEKKIEIYQKLGRDEDARKTFRELAEIYYETSHLEQAYNIYERLFSMDPDDEEIKNRFNQISIELRGRPIDMDKLVQKPSFESIIEETSGEDDEMFKLDAETLDIESGDGTLESLFDTREIESISIPVFGDVEERETPVFEDEIADDIFSDEEEEPVAVEAQPSIEPGENQINDYRIEAGVFLKYGMFKNAADKLNSILVINPEDEEALEKLTEVYEKMGQMDLVIQTMEKRIKILSKSDKKAAKKLLKEALKLDSDNPALLKLSKKLDVSVPASDVLAGDMAPLTPAKSDSSEKKKVAVSQERYPETGDMAALVDLSKMGEAETTFSASESKLTSDLAEVVREFREELISKPDEKDAETHYNLGIAYKEMGLIDEAVEELKLTLDFPSHLMKSSGLLAQCYMELGESGKAARVLEKALKNTRESAADSPELLSLKYDLAMVHKGEGEFAEALKLLKDIKATKKKYRDVDKQIKEIGKLM